MNPRALALAFVFALGSLGWGQAQIAEWFSPDGGGLPAEDLGRSVALDGDLVLVSSAVGDFGLQWVSVFSISSDTQVFRLEAADNEPGDGFGGPKAAQGGLALLGASGDDDLGLSAGAVYLFDLQTGLELMKIKAPDGQPGDHFGTAVALSSQHLLVGAWGDDDLGSNTGSAYVLDRQTGAPLQKLLPINAVPFQSFACSLAIDGDFAVVGGTCGGFLDDAGNCSVFNPHTGAWLGFLSPSDPGPDDRFGASIALDGNLAVVGAPGKNGNVGAAYVFDVTTRQELFQLNDTPQATPLFFGGHLDMHGSRIAVGTVGGVDPPGRVLLFDGLSGQLLDEFTHPQLTVLNGSIVDVAIGANVVVSSAEDAYAPEADYAGVVLVHDLASGVTLNQFDGGEGASNDRFGWAVAVDGPMAVVGARADNPLGQESGSAYVIDIETGDVMFDLSEPGGAADNQFGFSVGISGTRAIVGAPGHGGIGPESGAAWIIDVTSGAALFELSAVNGAAYDRFGESVAIDGTRAVVGSPQFGGGEKGLAYVFDATTGNQLVALRPDDPVVSFDKFGTSVAISGQLAIVGAPYHDLPLSNAGAAYIFDVVTGDQLLKLTASDANALDQFGISVALEGTKALVGAREAGSLQAGAAYLFDTSTGQELLRFSPNDATGFDEFGLSVALFSEPAGAQAVVSSRNGGVPGSNGVAAYVYDAFSGGQLAKLVAESTNAITKGVATDGVNVYLGVPFESKVTVFDAPSAPIPQVYCTAKLSSAGCSAQIGSSNLAAQPVSGANDYFITATSVQAFKLGLVFAGLNGPSAIPFLGGTLCVQPPLAKRGPLVYSGGTVEDSCSGSFATLINDGQPLQQNIPNALDGGPGTSVWFQYWYRDPANGSGTLGTALSNALRVDFQ